MLKSIASGIPLQEDELVSVNSEPSARAGLARSASGLAVTAVSAVLCAIYAYYFYLSIAPYWFHPDWVTDDSLQQIYPFHKVLHPGLFKGDIITLMMESYLVPIHYWLSYAITWLTGDPIMMGHWVMLIQIVASLGFVFLAVDAAAGKVPAFFAVAWLLHTRHIMQRLTGGLPRGWAACVFLAYLCFVLRGQHRAVLVTLLIGCLLHPPATLIAAGAYGMLLAWRFACARSRDRYRKPFITYLCLSPIYIALTLMVLKTPPEIGTMASYERAASMPEFLRPKGRFPFVPLKPAVEEIRTFGFQAFVTRFYDPPRFYRFFTPEIVIGILAIVLALGLYRRRRTVPAEVLFFGLSAMGVYFASRVLAFKLYVPDRHLQFPMGIFFITAFSIGVWRLLHREDTARSAAPGVAWASILGLCGIGALVFVTGGTGLYGAANFNYTTTKRGDVFLWLRSNTPEDSTIGGHPTFIDGVQLFGRRRGYVNTETAHPFYDKYYEAIKPRIELSLRAHYAKTLEELVQLSESAGIDYFVFGRRYFYEKTMKVSGYHAPFDSLVKELASRDPEDYAYRKLPQSLNRERYPFLMFRDKQSVVVDIKKLKEYLQNA